MPKRTAYSGHCSHKLYLQFGRRLVAGVCFPPAPHLCSACDEIVSGAGRAKREVDSSRHGLKSALRCGQRGMPSAAASYAVHSMLILTVR